MKPFSEQTYAIMRMAVGFAFFWHGCHKLVGFPPFAGEMNPALYVAGGIELVGGLCVAIGLMTNWAAFLSSGLMAAAYWVAHGTQGVLPIQNQGELSFLYCFVFLFLSARGSGIWSVDGARGA
jgi:putative oxidoreductase